jgi:hypothetical protein
MAILALLLGWLTPAHAVPPPTSAPIEVVAPAPDHDQAPPDVIVFLAAYRANGPPSGHGRVAFIFVFVGRSTHSGGWKEYAYAGGDPVNRWDPSGLDDVRIEGGLAYWIFQDESGRTKGEMPIAMTDGKLMDFGRSTDQDISKLRGVPVEAMQELARSVHYNSNDLLMSLRQFGAGTWEKGMGANYSGASTTYASQVGDFYRGYFWEAPQEFVGGLYQLARHPFDSGFNIGQSIYNYDTTWQGIKDHYYELSKTSGGHGRITFEIATTVLTLGEGAVANGTAKVGQLAGAAGRMLRAGRSIMAVARRSPQPNLLGLDAVLAAMPAMEAGWGAKMTQIADGGRTIVGMAKGSGSIKELLPGELRVGLSSDN